MKILAFAASNSSRSINGQLVGYAARRLETELADGASVDVIDLNDFEMPLYGVDREEREGIPQLARDFQARIREADAVLISFAEHNGSYTVAFKNVYDWVSRLDGPVWQDKPVAMLSTSPGPRGGAGVLAAATSAAPFAGGDLRGSLPVPGFPRVYDAEAGELTDPALRQQLDEVLTALVTDVADDEAQVA